MKERLYEILRNPKEFLLDGEKLILEKDDMRIVMENNGEELSIYEEGKEPDVKEGFVFQH